MSAFPPPPLPPPSGLVPDDDNQDDRYFPTTREIEILVPNLKLYFSFPKRSQARRDQIAKTLEQLTKEHPGHWNEKNVRVWFTNNQKGNVSGEEVNPEFFKKTTASHHSRTTFPYPLPRASPFIPWQGNFQGMPSIPINPVAIPPPEKPSPAFDVS
jgi:hypothetical protein